MRFFLPVLICTVSLLIALPSTVGAAIVENLYSATVPIENQSARQRKEAAKQALKEVLSKVSGQQALLSDANIKQALAQAENLLLSYQFDIQPQGINYQAQFDSQKVEQLIRNSGYPIWGKHRPETLIWLAQQPAQSSERQLVSDSGASELVKVVKQQANRRGIDVSFPVLDLIDLQQVSVYDVWSSYSQTVVAASERYRTDYVLLARLYFNRGNPPIDDMSAPNATAEANETSMPADVWVVEWLLSRQNQFESGELYASDKQQAVSQMIDQLADSLASKYAISAVGGEGQDNTTEIQIAKIGSLTAYSQVVEFLRSLSMVIDVRLVKQQGDIATFELELFGQQDNLQQAFRLEDRLRKPVDAFGQAMADQPLEWRP